MNDVRIRAWVPKLAAAALFLAACVGTFVLWATYHLACVDETAEGDQCARRPDEFLWANRLGWAALAVAAGMLIAGLIGRRRTAFVLYAAALAAYLAGFYLLDAAMHGWENLTFFPEP
jgi:hypothetical protein